MRSFGLRNSQACAESLKNTRHYADRRCMGRDPAERAAHRLLCGRLAGVLFAAGSLASVPVNLMFQPAVDERAYLITVVGVLSGLICLCIPWDRIGALWLHLVPVVAALEVVLTMWGVGQHAQAYLWFLAFVAVFVAFAFDTRRDVALHLAFVIAAAMYPLVTADVDRANVLAGTLICVPILLVATGVIVYLRERLSAVNTLLAEEAVRDPLTGVGNRRVLDRMLDYELTRHRRHARPLSVIVLDLDGFKEVNDTLGHLAGDQLLVSVANRLREVVRDQDTVIRQGGDEFCVIAPETDALEAAMLVQRIKAGLRELVANGSPLSTSAGAATFPADATSTELLLASADARQREDKTISRSDRGVLAVIR
jgi:diguanylate cyclase (GGDEF)-like protein